MGATLKSSSCTEKQPVTPARCDNGRIWWWNVRNVRGSPTAPKSEARTRCTPDGWAANFSQVSLGANFETFRVCATYSSFTTRLSTNLQISERLAYVHLHKSKWYQIFPSTASLPSGRMLSSHNRLGERSDLQVGNRYVLRSTIPISPSCHPHNASVHRARYRTCEEP